MNFEPKLIHSEWWLSWMVPLSPLSSFAKTVQYHSSWRLLETADKIPPVGGSASCIPDTFWWPLKQWLQPWLLGTAKGQPPCSTQRGRKNPAKGFAFSWHTIIPKWKCCRLTSRDFAQKWREETSWSSSTSRAHLQVHKLHNALDTIQFYTSGGPFHSDGYELITHAFQPQVLTMENVSIKNSVTAT